MRAVLRRVLAQGERYGTSDAGAARPRCCSSSCRPIPPGRCTSATAARPPTARRWPTCCAPPATTCTASTTSTTPAGRWTSSPPACGCVTCERGGERIAVSRQRLSRRLRARDRRAAARARRREAASAPAAEVLTGLPADAPAGDKEKHIDALIERMRAAARRRRLSRRCWSWRSAAMLADIRDDLAEFGVEFEQLVLRARAGARTAPSSARSRGSNSRASCTRRTARSGSAPAPSATTRTGCWCATTGSTTYFAPDIAYHLDKRERGFEQLIDVLGRRSPRLHGARARRPDGDGRAGRLPRGAA